MGKQDLTWEFQVQLDERTKTRYCTHYTLRKCCKDKPHRVKNIALFFSMRQWLDGLLHVTSVSPVLPGRQQSESRRVRERALSNYDPSIRGGEKK